MNRRALGQGRGEWSPTNGEMGGDGVPETNALRSTQTGGRLQEATPPCHRDYSWEGTSGPTCGAASMGWMVKTSVQQTRHEEAVVRVATTMA